MPRSFLRVRHQSKDFSTGAGVLAWGIVPAGYDLFAKESLGVLIIKLEGIWQYLGKKGVCLVNPDKGKTVENTFSMVNHLSYMRREKYKLI
jgi:hypothetical protein